MLAAWASGAGVARADTLLYDGISVISGAQSSVQSFNVATPGTLTLTLSSIPWLDVVSNLSGFLSTTSAQIGDLYVPVDWIRPVAGWAGVMEVGVTLPTAVRTGDGVALVLKQLGQDGRTIIINNLHPRWKARQG